MGIVFGGLLLLSIVAGALSPLWLRRKKREIRTVKGIELTSVDWLLLGDIATKKRISQASLISQVLKHYLNTRIDDNLKR